MRSAVILSCFLGLGACGHIRGVAPENQHLYTSNQNGKWACLSDPSIELSLDQINDDFCDCPDGSDEPGTNACPFTAERPQYFYCENAGHKPAYIENFKLNDGVCDYDICCDGSDEYRSGACPSVCEGVAKQLAQYVRNTKKHLSGALEIKQGLKKKARVARDKIEQKLTEVVAQLQSSEARLSALAKDLDTAKSGGGKDHSVAAKVSEEISEHMDLLEQKATAMAKAAEEKNRHIALLEGYLEDLRVNYNPNFNDLAVKRTVNSFADYLSNKPVDVNKVVVDTKDYRIDHLLKKVKNIQSGGSMRAPMGEVVPTLKGLLTHYYSKWVSSSAEQKPVGEVSNETTKKIAGEIKSLQKKVEALKSEQGMHQDNLKANLGHNDIFRSVQGQWINKKIGEYNYRLGFLDSVYQDNTLVGRFTGFDGKAMQYSHGSKCWNGPQRSAKIDMVCGHNSDLISVSEPEKCQYRFLISSPLACEDLADEDIEKGFKVDLDSLT